MKKASVLSIVCITSILSGLFGCAEPQQTQSAAEEEPVTFAQSNLPSLYSDYVFLEDAKTHQVIIDKNSEERMYPASMTKMMTAILAIENIPDPEEVTITFTNEMLEGLDEANANQAGFAAGDAPTALDCIYGDLLPSGADCSRALAFYIAGSEQAYVAMMNDKAAELGMNHTHFVNTSGLHDDNHYTTCRDMAVLLEYCMQSDLFVQVLSSRYHQSVPVKHYRKGLWMSNYVLMYLEGYDPKYDVSFYIPGFICGKSGYTIEGQYTLASCAEINGRRLILVNGHGFLRQHYPASIDDASKIYNWFADNWSYRTLVAKGDIYGSLTLEDSSAPELNAISLEELTVDAPKAQYVAQETVLEKNLKAPVKKGDKVGTLKIYGYSDLLGEVSLVAEKDVDADFRGRLNTLVKRVESSGLWMVSLLLIALIIFLVHALIHPSRRRKRKQ